MASFPTLSVCATNDFKEEIIKPIVKTQFEGNYAQTRPKYTRTTKNFTLKYMFITEADKSTLNAFFETYRGSSFDWTHPRTSTVHSVRFAEDILKYKYLDVGLYEVSVPLEEI